MQQERAQAVVGSLDFSSTPGDHAPNTRSRETLIDGRLRSSSQLVCWHMSDTEAAEERAQEQLSLQARVSHVVVRTMKDLYGRGPTHAKSYFCDEYVFCVMTGGMTRDEETMIRGGEHEAVRDYRLRFQAVIAPELIRRVEDVLERKVISYHSQVLFDPDRLVEMFVLDRAGVPGTNSASE